MEINKIPLDQPFGQKNENPSKQICDFCEDFIVGGHHSIERPFGKRKGYITYKYFVVDEGCQLFLEARGLVDDVFLQDISPGA